MRQIVLDTETTGLEPREGHRIIEIGCVELIDRRLTGNNYHVYINPERDVDEGALKVHGISNEFLKDKPIFADIIHDFLEYVGTSELVIHNAAFDVGFINHELKLAKSRSYPIEKSCSILDTLLLAREKHPRQKNNLDALCKRYEIDNSKRDLHGALLDAEILALVFLAMTGGQEEMFSSEQAHDANQLAGLQSITDKSTVARESGVVLPVLLPTDEELSSHRDFVGKYLNDAKGLWD